MIVYQELKHQNQSEFQKLIVSSDGEIIKKRTISCPMMYVKRNDFTYIVLYDDNMEVIHEAFDYLNYNMSTAPITTRNSAAHALRLLYCFLSLNLMKPDGLTSETLSELIKFLRGISPLPEQYSLQTYRSVNTVNTYLSVYRSFFRSRNIKCDELFKFKNIKITENINGVATDVPRIRYTSNLKSKSFEKEVPKYISPAEFRKLYQLAIDKQDRTAQLLMHLMYGYGLRLGEALGITLEDITQTHSDDGRLLPVIILRNRKSDNSFQYAKGLTHPDSGDKCYSDPELGKAYWKIFISEELYAQLTHYINEYHEKMRFQYPSNYLKGYADIVTSDYPLEYNHYVFLNQYGKVLSAQAWNYRLKKYFDEAGIPVDYGAKKDNLSHRFRHGYAMFLVLYSKHSIKHMELKEKMRHKSIASTMRYFNPTDSDKNRMREAFDKDLFAVIPELKEAIDHDQL